MITTERNVQYVFSILSRGSTSQDDGGSTVAILDTLHYQHGSLRNWYYTDDTTGEVLRRDRRECSKERILEVFGDGVPNGCPVAMYLHLCAPGWQVSGSVGKDGASSSPARLLLGAESRRSSTYLTQHRQEEAAQLEREDPDFMSTNPSVLNAKRYCAEFSDDAFPIAVDYFDREKLEGFLETRDNKHDVLVQRFVDGGAVNDNFTTIEAVWSPYQLFLNQRQSIVSVKQVDVPLQTRCHTFDNDALFNRPLRTTSQMRSKVKRECANIVRQIEQVERKSVIRMVAYFSVTKNNAPILLWVPELQMMDIPQQQQQGGGSSPLESPSKAATNETQENGKTDGSTNRKPPIGKTLKGKVSNEVEVEDVNSSDTKVAANKMSLQRQRQLLLISPPIVPSDVRLPADWKNQLASKHAKRGGTSPPRGDVDGRGGGSGSGGFDPTSRVTALKGIPRIGRRNIGFEGVAAMTATGGPTASLPHDAEIPTWIASAIAHKRNVDQQLAMLDATFALSKAATAPTSQLDRQRRVASVMYSGGLGSRPQSRTGNSPIETSLTHNASVLSLESRSNARGTLQAYDSLPSGTNVAQRRAISSNGHRPPIPITKQSVYHTNIMGEPVVGAAKRMGAHKSVSTSGALDYSTACGFSIKGASMLLDPFAAAEEQRAQANRARDRGSHSKRFYTAANASANQFSHSYQHGLGFGQKGVLALTAARSGKGMQPARASTSLGASSAGRIGGSSYLRSHTSADNGTDGNKRELTITHNPSQSEVDRLVIASEGDTSLNRVPSPTGQRPNSPLSDASGYWSDKERVYSRGGGGGYFVRKIRSAGTPPPASKHSNLRIAPIPLDTSAIESGATFGEPTESSPTLSENRNVRSGSSKIAKAIFSSGIDSEASSPLKGRLSSLIAQSQVEGRLGDSLRNTSMTNIGVWNTPAQQQVHRRLSVHESLQSRKDSSHVTINWNLVLEHAQHTQWLALERDGDRPNTSIKRLVQKPEAISPTRGLRLPSASGGLGGSAPTSGLSSDLHMFLWIRAKGHRSEGSRTESGIGLPTANLFTATPVGTSLDHPMIAAQSKHTRLSIDAFAPRTLHEGAVLWDVDFFSESDAAVGDIAWVESQVSTSLTQPLEDNKSKESSTNPAPSSPTLRTSESSQLSPEHLTLLDRSYLVTGGCNALVKRKHVTVPKRTDTEYSGQSETIVQKRLTVNLWDLFDTQLSQDSHSAVIKAHQRYLLGIEGLMSKLQNDFYGTARGAGGEFVECGNVPIEIPLVYGEGVAGENGEAGENISLLQFPPMLVPHILGALLQLLPQRKEAQYAKSFIEPFTAEIRRLTTSSNTLESGRETVDAAREAIGECRSRTEQLQQLGIDCIQQLLLVTPEEEERERERQKIGNASEGAKGPDDVSHSKIALAFKRACLTDLFERMKTQPSAGTQGANALVNNANRRKSSVAGNTAMYPDVLAFPNALLFLCHSSATLHSALSALAQITSLIEMSMVACEIHSLMDVGDRLQLQMGRLEELRKIRKVRVRKQEQEAQRAAAMAALQQQQGPHALPTGGLRAGPATLMSPHPLGTLKRGQSMSMGNAGTNRPSLTGIPGPKPPSATEAQVPPIVLFNASARFAYDWPNSVFSHRTVVALQSAADANEVHALGSSQIATGPSKPPHLKSGLQSHHQQQAAIQAPYDGEDDEPHLSAANLQFIALLLEAKIRQRLEGTKSSDSLNAMWPPRMVLF